MGDVPAFMLFVMIVIALFFAGFVLGWEVNGDYDNYKFKVERCKVNYSNSIEELTKCFDVQLEKGGE